MEYKTEEAAYHFQALPTQLLVDILHGNVDAIEQAKAILISMGLDQNGKWVGTQNAKELHN